MALTAKIIEERLKGGGNPVILNTSPAFSLDDLENYE